jgi:hypothetical protein
MALLPEDYAKIRRKVVEKIGPENINFINPQINAGLDAIEDWFEANRANISAAIDASGFSFTGPQKLAMVKFWLWNKFGREA